MANKPGYSAEKIDAIARQRFALSLGSHPFIRVLLAAHGRKDLLPEGVVKAYENSPLPQEKESVLQRAKRAGGLARIPGGGEGFQYRVYLGSGDYDGRMADVVARGQKITFDATSDEERFVFPLRRIAKAKSKPGMDIAETAGTDLSNTGVETMIDAAMIELVTRLSSQVITGDGVGDNLNGLGDVLKAIMYWEGEADGAWAGKTYGGLDQNINKVTRNQAYTTDINDALTTPENLLKHVSLALSYAGRMGTAGRFGLMSRGTKARFEGVMRKAHTELMGVSVSWNPVGLEVLNILLGEHMLVSGAPMAVDDHVAANKILIHNLSVLGLDWKGGKSPIKSTGLIDLASVASGYEIGTLGIQIEFVGNLICVVPGCGALINSFTG